MEGDFCEYYINDLYTTHTVVCWVTASTQVEPSLSQAQQAPQGPIDANQIQNIDPPPSEQGQGQGQSNDGVVTPPVDQGQAHVYESSQDGEQDHVEGQGQGQSSYGDASPMVDQGQGQVVEDAHVGEKTQVEGQGKDQNGGDDQGVSQESLEEAQARRAKKVEETPCKGSHTLESVIGTVRKGVSTRRQLANFSSHHAYISCVEPQKVFEALEDPDWAEAMHEELNNFERNKVWSLVEKPKDCCNVIGTRWVFKNKQDANGIFVRNKARLVAQGYSQVEGIDYGKIFAPVAHLESIRILLAYASHNNFKLQQMDVKGAFLNGPLHELVYVKQPLGFENPNFPNHVYKLDKALYGLKQAPRAWYEHLKELLVDRGFEIGLIDPTLFTKKVNGDIFICQLYVDDINLVLLMKLSMMSLLG
jgi:hypothetical protein